jgi:hypothetical protein
MLLALFLCPFERNLITFLQCEQALSQQSLLQERDYKQEREREHNNNTQGEAEGAHPDVDAR